MCHKQRGVPAATMPATCQSGGACLFLGVLAHPACRVNLLVWDVKVAVLGYIASMGGPWEVDCCGG